MKKLKKKERYIESSTGEDLNKFVNNLSNKVTQAEALNKFIAGGSYDTTIGKVIKKKLEGGKYIKGSWKRRRKILFKKSKKGKRIESRKNWKKSHPLKTNPAKALRMKGKQGRKARKLLGIKPKSRKIAKLKAKIGKLCA